MFLYMVCVCLRIYANFGEVLGAYSLCLSLGDGPFAMKLGALFLPWLLACKSSIVNWVHSCLIVEPWQAFSSLKTCLWLRISWGFSLVLKADSSSSHVFRFCAAPEGIVQALEPACLPRPRHATWQPQECRANLNGVIEVFNHRPVCRNPRLALGGCLMVPSHV